ncbi:hypothetical protein G7077_05115 [Sphingomonas piscis]|uniref:Phospholipase D-like domain-containing protein n=1 Tax=Sphingomonas piscis TaxID=2714943 RepID=A0A6G7YNQ8_9SPHN|nr:hypothetical protein [Sphingomonas piscis]QIK78378.1 hypothetical protein G7077_05115 [Sphingomonas piscis]
MIYIKKGEKVYLYRAGPHSIEDNLAPPNDLSVAADVPAAFQVEGPATSNEQTNSSTGRLISSLRTPALWQIIHGRRLIPHKEIILVSPFLTNSLLVRMGKLGRLLDDWIEDGTKITLVTKPPPLSDHGFFADLEGRGIDLLFHHRLHSKLYVFAVDPSRFGYGQKADDLIVLGSANLTQEGFYCNRDTGNEELCYNLPGRERDNVESYVAYLALASKDLMQLKINASRQKLRIS